MKSRKPNESPPCDPEVLEWWLMTPAQRWEESSKLWETFIALGGSLDPEPDRQSPFYFPEAIGTLFADEDTGLHSVRGGGNEPARRSSRKRGGRKRTATRKRRK